MNSVNEIWKNHLVLPLHAKRRAVLCDNFPMLSKCNHNNYLSIYKYLKDIPEKFYSKKAYLTYNSFLEQCSKTMLVDLLNENQNEINKSLHLLEEINRYPWHDDIFDKDEYELLRFCDTTLNPTYLKLVEGVFYPLIYIPAFFSRKSRKKPTNCLDIYNSVEEIKKSSFSNLCEFYNNTIRNGIAHGNIIYKQNEMIFKGKKGSPESVSARNLIKLIDNFLDLCNGIALSIKEYFLTYLDDVLKIPLQIMVEELQAQTEVPWWHIEGCLISEINRKSQLMIYVTPNTKDYLKVQYSAYLTGVLSEQLAPFFDRYFISIRSSKSLPGWAAFDGQKLRTIREKGPTSINDYEGVFDPVFYVPKGKRPKILLKLETYYVSYKIQKKLFVENHKYEQKIPDIYVRNVTIHRNGVKAVLGGSVFISNLQEQDPQDMICRYKKKIIKKAFKSARKGLTNRDICKFLFLGYARISVFLINYRKRKLNSFGLGHDLVCTIEIKKIKRIKDPDIFESTIEQKGCYRIAWNKSWLEKNANKVN
ncbi:MAG: hypothetical protein WCS73_06825 [Lentisphaeria bacterium]